MSTFGFDGKGPKLIPGKDVCEMVQTKKDEDLYLVYQVDPKIRFHVGELDLTPVAKGGDSYSPQLMPLDTLIKQVEKISDLRHEVS